MGGAKSVLPESLGQGTSAAITPTLIKGAGSAVSRVANSPGVRSTVTAPVRFAARTAEAAANSKLRPGLKLFTPADEALKTKVKIPGRDFGLNRTTAQPSPFTNQPLRLSGAIEGEYLPPEEKAPGRWANARVVQPKQLPAEASPVESLPYGRTGDEIIQDDLSAPPSEQWTAGRIPQRQGLQLSGNVEPRRLIEQVRNADEVTPALTGKLPDYYETDERAWQRYSNAESPEDLADTRSLQEQVRNQYDIEQRGRLNRGLEEGYAKNARLRTPKSELQRRFARSAPASSGQTLIERARAALLTKPEPRATSIDEDLLPLLTESVRLARLRQR